MTAQRITCTNAEYHARDELSSSQLALFLDDPLSWHHYCQAQDWPRRDPTAAMARGTLTHELIEIGVDEMLAGRLDSIVKVIPQFALNVQGHCKGKAWTEWRDANPARHYLKPNEINPFEIILQHLKANETTARIIEIPDKEVSLVWQDAATGIRCRARVDVLDESNGLIIDWKTTVNNDKNDFLRSCERLHYMERLAFYAQGIQALTGHAFEPLIIAIKSRPSFSIRPYTVPEYLWERAHWRVDQTLERIANFELNDELNAKPQALTDLLINTGA